MTRVFKIHFKPPPPTLQISLQLGLQLVEPHPGPEPPLPRSEMAAARGPNEIISVSNVVAMSGELAFGQWG